MVWRHTGLARIAAALATVAALLVVAGCKRDIYAVNEANPFYQAGLEARQAGRYEEAAKEFRSCVYYSPTSYKAHLQLAVLYDDHLDDPAAALVHYRRCLEGAADPSIQAQASAALERAELRLYESLAPRYAPAMPAPVVQTPPTAITPAATVAGVAPPVPVPAEAIPVEAIPPTTPGDPSPATEPPPGTVAQVEPVPAETPLERPDRSEFLRSRILATHTIASGDTLEKLAKQYYGDSSKWPFIYNANRDTLTAANKLRIGQKIRIPSLERPR